MIFFLVELYKNKSKLVNIESTKEIIFWSLIIEYLKPNKFQWSKMPEYLKILLYFYLNNPKFY
jgi:hypothetical protein